MQGNNNTSKNCQHKGKEKLARTHIPTEKEQIQKFIKKR